MRLSFLIAIAAMLLLSACAQNEVLMTTDLKLAKADELFANGKYARAAELYGDVYFERASAAASHALLRQADCYFRINKFADARAAYDEFIGTFPNSPDISTAYFRSALCLYEESLPAQYDQTETLQAIDAFKKFIEKYPTDSRYSQSLEYIRKAQYKLIEKKFLTGYIYFKMKDYSSALMYFQEITDLGNTDRLDRESLYYSALLLHRQKLNEEAGKAYSMLVGKYPGSKESKNLEKYFK